MRASLEAVWNVKLHVQTLEPGARSRLGREVKRNDRVGNGTDSCCDGVIAADLHLNRRALWALENEPGNDRAGGGLAAEQDLEGDELIACRVQCDASVARTPEMIGGQIVLGFGRDQFAGRRVDFVKLVQDRDLQSGDLRQCGRRVGWSRSWCGRGPGQGGRDAARDRDIRRRRWSAIAGSVDRPYRKREGRSGGKLQVAEMHLDSLARVSGQRDQLAREWSVVERHEETESSGRTLIFGRQPRNQRLAGWQG